MNFIKNPFEDCIKRLLNQIILLKPSNRLSDNQTSTNFESISQHKEMYVVNVKNEHDDVSKWSEDQVEKWFQQNGYLNILERIEPCDGRLLYQLNKMRLTAPEFFYQSISNKNELDLRSLLVFADKLDILFKNDK